MLLGAVYFHGVSSDLVDGALIIAVVASNRDSIAHMINVRRFDCSQGDAML